MAFINLNSEIPGPKSREVLARREKAVTRAVARSTQVVIDRAEGALVHDVDGNTLIDMAGGIGMLAGGHCPPAVVEAMREQAGKLIHPCFLVGTYEPYVDLAEMLNECTPGDFDKKSILVNSGSEAVENAVKIARCHTGRQGIIVFEGAYHGRTLLTLSMTSKYGLFKKGFGPFAPEIYRLPIPNLYRRPESMAEEEYIQWSIAQLENALIAQVDPSAVAAIVIEPVQGEAGFLPVPAPFLAKIREICDEHGIVMVADEVQCGMGRTGRLWAIEHYDIVPDLLISGKSLGSGMPIASVTGRAEIMDAPHPGGAGGTYSGAPLACVAAIESLKLINSPDFLAEVRRKAAIIRSRMESWKEQFPIVGDVRGLGAMLLVEFVRDRQTRHPAPEETLEIIKDAVSKGLLLIRAGLYSNCIRLLPPLVITDEQLDEALTIIENSIALVQDRQEHARAACVNG
ncbi:MAG: 4-aminobutyrate--2-oxoglutarate transaminase [Candidatus Sumerlaeia bacterium]|nr:4-aminobutyrate--2-oxoglutarate transaminase [Candidatus Sumerlaeia bacterium]